MDGMEADVDQADLGALLYPEGGQDGPWFLRQPIYPYNLAQKYKNSILRNQA